MTQGAATGLRIRPEGDGAGGLAVADRVAIARADLREIEAWRADSFCWRSAFDRGLLGLADAAGVTIALLAVLALFGKHGVPIAALACVPLALSLFKLAGLYAREELRVKRSTLDEIPRLLQITGVIVLVIAILQPAFLPNNLAGLQIAWLWIATLLAVTSGRLLARWLTWSILPGERCLVLGDPEQASRVRERLAESRVRARVIACLPLSSDDVEEMVGRACGDLIRDLRVDRLIVAPAATDTNGGVELIRMAKAMGARVSVLPRIFDVIGSDVEFDEVNGVTLLGVHRFGLSGTSRAVKRTFDLVIASIGLVVVGPLISAIALAIRLESGGPVLFRQVRVGRDGKLFQMIKFRSMVAEADNLKEGLRYLSEPGDGLFKIADDPRVTRVGKFLRRSSLDELPQIFNVLRGEMSLVGPRPLVIEEDAMIVGLARSRLHLTPGMTGPWQISGLRLPLHEMVEVDYRYVANWSLWLDLKLLLRTVPYVTRRDNV